MSGPHINTDKQHHRRLSFKKGLFEKKRQNLPSNYSRSNKVVFLHRPDCFNVTVTVINGFPRFRIRVSVIDYQVGISVDHVCFNVPLLS